MIMQLHRLLILSFLYTCCAWNPTHSTLKRAKTFPYTGTDSTEIDLNSASRSNAIRSICTAALFTSVISTVGSCSSQATTGAGVAEIPVAYDGTLSPLKSYLGGKGTLIVNVASYCALTPQYEGLVSLYKNYHSQGFNIIGFPCNQFGSQEPAPVATIRTDVARDYGVEFPILDKIDVNGPAAHPLYQALKSYSDIGVSNIGRISWNFEKFLLDANGTPVRRYKPGVEPEYLDADIKSLLVSGTVQPRKKATLNDY